MISVISNQFVMLIVSSKNSYRVLGSVDSEVRLGLNPLLLWQQLLLLSLRDLLEHHSRLSTCLGGFSCSTACVLVLCLTMTSAGRLTHIANPAAVLQMPNVLPLSHAEPQPIPNNATAAEKMWENLKCSKC